MPQSLSRYLARVRHGLRAADLIVAPTRAMLDATIAHYGPVHRTRVIPNGRSLPPITARREPLILSAGRLWDQAKNMDALQAVASRVAWPVCIAGDQRHPDGGEVVLPNVRLLGKLSSARMAHWFARASVYALPARYEPFGLSVLEAALSGCALVLGDIPSLREVWDGAALFVAPDDHDALADALQRLVADELLRARHAERARERASRYTPAAMAAAYRSAYAAIGSAHAPHLPEGSHAVPQRLASTGGMP